MSLTNDAIELTVIVPMHDALAKMSDCLESLRQLGDRVDHEVIFVDDASTDGTTARLEKECEDQDRWRVVKIAKNTGSPSTGRNLGIEGARGRWVFFLDGDDAIRVDGIVAALEAANQERNGVDVDIVRGPVELVYVGRRRFVIDRIPKREVSTGRQERIAAIARHQSLTCMALIRTALLREHNIRFDTKVRMGEDITFMAEALVRARDVAYVDLPLFSYLRREGGANSAMHSIRSREFAELAESWRRVESSFRSTGLSYLELHGLSTVTYAVRQVIQHRKGRIKESSFAVMSRFVRENWAVLGALDFAPRIAEVLGALHDADYAAFEQSIKARLLIAGHDLKFIRDAEAELSQNFSIRYDEWPSERVHDESRSKEAAAWADFVWCEWLAAAAVWYSQNTPAPAKVVVRVHRYELGRTYGDEIDSHRISAFIAIALHCYEDLVDRFQYPRGKVRYIPNYYRVADYAQGEGVERLKRLAMIGIAPRRKGFLRALELLQLLRETDPEFTLTVMGKSPLEYPWIAGDPAERAYFEACERYIEEHELQSSVQYLGWVDTTAVAKDYGFVLSMSDHEGSHVGPGEAFCANNQGLFLNWRGVEYVYPERFVFEDVPSMSEHVLAAQDLELFEEGARFGRKHIESQFDISLFVNRVKDLWSSL